ncbi:hypothetical protein OG898_12045 [Streptomyces sp. NBC_00193]|uniref:hypothetical protein n=1 Tax=Streptomyces sp. NBC_00193 TaxID=2975675 RepID=UPI00225A7F70|nr:hypothetical protein [Streptomyces sp. NBC_00193]MCX5297221.1 hypothetical protein [Streptomyces sp. NBC_00193]
MRTALRTSIVTAALAGALLAPAATAIAAPAQAAQPVTAVSAVSADPSGNERYDGEIVQLGKGKIAVLRNKSEGPEVWIRAGAGVAQPGTARWAGRVLAVLDLTHPLAVLDGVQYKLTNNGEGFDIRVLGEGASTFQLMPKAEPAAKPSTKPAAKPAAKPSAKPAAKPATDAKPQTVVVPKGPVAAGAELAPQDDVNTAAIGAGLVAMFAALATALMLRARKARTRA